MDFLGAIGFFKAFLAWRSAAEILLIAAGLFFLYRTLVRLGTWKIATGILVAVAIFLVARFLNLRTIEWIFGNLSQAAVLALIVIFLTDEYGTRHHAAMGLAEKSDALTVLVSEERGQVSLFLTGAMRPLAHADELVTAIIRHWKETAAYPFVIPGGRARREMMSQMIASLALAVAFWTTLFISQGEQLEKMVTVPVEFTATPSDLLLVGDKDKEVRLHIAGSRSELNALDPSQNRISTRPR